MDTFLLSNYVFNILNAIQYQPQLKRGEGYLSGRNPNSVLEIISRSISKQRIHEFCNKLCFNSMSFLAIKNKCLSFFKCVSYLSSDGFYLCLCVLFNSDLFLNVV